MLFEFNCCLECFSVFDLIACPSASHLISVGHFLNIWTEPIDKVKVTAGARAKPIEF